MVFFTLVLCGVIWLTQSLRIVDVILNNGQSGLVFLEMAALLLPQTLSIVLPIALLCAILYALNRMALESELTVMRASGASHLQIAAPILVLAMAVTIILYGLFLYLVPMSAKISRDRLFEIKTDIAAALIQEGTFNSPAKGLTVYIRDMSRSGEMRGILIHDNRDGEMATTYMASRSTLVRTLDGPRLIMQDGNIQRVERSKGQINMLYFQQYIYDLSQFTQSTAQRTVKLKEMSLQELLYPEEADMTPRRRAQFAAKAHERLTSPLYAVAFAMIAVVGIMRARHSRRGNAMRIFATVGVALVVRVAGLGLQNLAAKESGFLILTYAIPVIVIIVGFYLLFDRKRQHGVPAMEPG